MLYIESALPGHPTDCGTLAPLLRINSLTTSDQYLSAACHRTVSRYFDKPLQIRFMPVAIRAVLDAMNIGE